MIESTDPSTSSHFNIIPSTPPPNSSLTSAESEESSRTIDATPYSSKSPTAPVVLSPRRQSQASDRSSRTSGSSDGARRISSDLLRWHSSCGGSDSDDLPLRTPTTAAGRILYPEGNQSRSGFNSSFRRRGSITWEHLARRRSTAEERRSNVSIDNDTVAVVTNDVPAADTSSNGWLENIFNSFRFTIANRRQSFLRSIKKASKHPRSIILPTLVTFVVLAAAGVIAVVHSSRQYKEEQSLQLLEQSRELAYELDDLLAHALLPLFTVKEMAGQFEEFRNLQPKIVQRGNTTYLSDSGRTFRNVSDICTDPEVVELYQRVAESIMQSSEMGNVLFNVQLQPAGVVCLNHPHITTYSNGITMDHTEAIGLDRVHDQYPRESVRVSIESGTVGTLGPKVLVQSTPLLDFVDETPHESLTFWTPIYITGYDLVTLDDGKRYENFWGVSQVLLDWNEVLAQVKLHEFFEERNMIFALIEVGEGGDDKVVEASRDVEPPLTRDTAREALHVQSRENWQLLVDLPPPRVGDPAWAIWGSMLVLLGSFLVSLALLLFLVSKNDHEELLCRCIPRSIVRRLHAGETVIEKYDLATICFIDIVSFTTMSGNMKAHEVMEMLQVLFREFDHLAQKHSVVNAETIGDAYITVSGGPDGNDATTGAANIATFALDAVDVVKCLKFHDGKQIKIRVGVASGPVVAGVIGTINVPKFTLFGETTSRAEEMEKTSLPLQIQCSEETMNLLRSNFRTTNAFQCKRSIGRGSEHAWWIVRSSEGTGGYLSELDDMILPSPTAKDEVSTANSTTLTLSDPRQSMNSKGTDENETYMFGEDVQMAPHAQRRSSSMNASEIVEGSHIARCNFEFENEHFSDNITEGEIAGTVADSWLRTSLFNVKISLWSMGLMFQVAASNKRILLGTFLTFAILCGSGLAIFFSFGHQYKEDKSTNAMDLANKADRWLEKEIAKALLPLFAMSELVKVVGKWNDLSFKILGTQQYTEGNSVYNNVTGLCDDPAYINPFVGMASSIKQSSGMQKILVNVQLAPSGVLCLTYPKNNTEDFPPGIYLDTSGAIGLNLFLTPSRAESSKAAVLKQGKTIQGPIKLAQGNLSVVDEALIARYPVFIDGNNMTINEVSYPFWGLTIVLMDWDKLISKFGIYNFFSRAEMQFRMTRHDVFNEEVVVIANSSDHDILKDHNSISVKLKTSDDDWTLMIGFNDGFSAPWLWWGTACICLGSLLASSLLMMVLTITEMNKMLLYRMMPRKAILVVEQGKTFVEREDEATILFSQVLGFEKMSGEMNSRDFLLMLTQLYTEFDKLALKFHCTKIETIGAYYIVKGPDPDFCSYGECEGVSQIALFALHAVELVRNYQYKGVKLQIRAGFATGPVVAGVIGSGGLPKYTVFGDTVNFSSRMESTSQPMKIQCSHHTYQLLRNSVQFVFDLEEREEEGELGVYVKGKGQTMTYWLLGYTVRKAADCGH